MRNSPPRHDPKRTVGWYINFHAPKSFSSAMALGNDDRLLDAFRESVRETMADIESEIQTRVRINNQSRDRDTGNIVWAEFVHLTARPIGGVPDMHPHTHAYVFNTTFDVKESRYKAAKISEAKRQMPLHQDHQIIRDSLSSEQRNAVQHILQSTDKFIAIRGGAGTGKTTMMSEAVEALKAVEAVEALKHAGYDVLPLAPSAAASRETLRESGFKNADTVAQFLHNPELQKQYNHKHSVIWVDKVGLLGVRDRSALVDRSPDARSIITGDTKQNNPVSRGDGFRLLEHHAGLRVAELTTIRRQKPAKYKEAVADLSKGNIEAGILKLDSIGAIKEIKDDKQRYDRIASDYVAFSTAKDTPLVVLPTRAEGHIATEAIRSKLQVKTQACG